MAAEAAMVEPRLLPQRLRALRVARLVRTSEPHPAEAVEPYHARIRDAVLEGLEPPLRIRHHREIARTLEQAGAQPEQIAQHYEAGELGERATVYLLRAARRAMDAFAFDQAAGFYRRTLALGTLVGDEVLGVQIDLGHALSNAGRGEAAAEAYGLALGAAGPAQRLDLMRRIAEQLLTAGRYQEGLDASRRALAELELSLPRSPGSAFRQLALLRVRLALRGLRYVAHNADELSAKQLARIDTCWSLSRGFASHDVILAQVLQGRALRFALEAGEPIRIARGLCFEYISRAIDGPKALAKQRTLLQRAQKIGDDADDPSIRAAVAFADGMGAHTGACDFKASAPLFEAASSILRSDCTDVAWERSLADEQRLIAYFWLGRWTDMTRDCPELCKHAADIGNLYWLNRFAGSYLSFVAELRDDVDESRRLIQLGEDTLPPDTSAIQRFGQLWCATRLDLYQQRWREALTRHEGWHADLLASLVLRVPLVGFTHQLDAARTYLLAARHDEANRRAHLKRALSAARKLERSHVAYGRSVGAAIRGAAAEMRGRPDEALERYQSAEADLEAHGIESLLTAVRRRRGELVGASEGAALVAATNRWYLTRGVHNADAMTAMLLPR
jgi:hypothetical protein